MKYLITGLGNIGAEYLGTRHNIGFEALDYMADQYQAKVERQQAEIENQQVKIENLQTESFSLYFIFLTMRLK